MLLAVCSLTVSFAASSDNMQPEACPNIRINLRSKSSLVAIPNGYMRVYNKGSNIGVEYYDNDFRLLSKKSLSLELPIWGGFYAGSDGYYYVTEGQVNEAEDNNAEVIRIIRYDSSWNRAGAASISSNSSLFGGEVRYPFDYGCVNMAESGGKLYMVTGHEGYVDDAVGQGHQGFLMVEVDKTAMTGKIVMCDLWHSFAQYIKEGSNGLYILEQSEGSRYTKLSRYVPETGSAAEAFPVFRYGGSHTSAWAIPCYASVDGLALSSSNALCVGTSIDQSQYDNVSSDTSHNIYLTVTPFSSFNKDSTEVKWLTSFENDGMSFYGLHITKVNDNRFLVSWETSKSDSEEGDPEDINDTLSGGKLHYLFVDGKGDVISKEFVQNAMISDCEPVVKGNNIVYYTANSNMVDFYTINAGSGAFSKVAYRVAGPNAAWNVNDGVLTISGEGPVIIDREGANRYELSTVSSYSFVTDDSGWNQVKNNVTGIRTESGITSIPERAFAYFNKLKTVELAEGLQSIGKEAFYGCSSLKDVWIPASVSEIGEDIVWTGSSWVSDGSHVTYATIHGACDSFAIAYARDNDIRYESPHDWEDDFTVDKQPDCTEYGSKSIHCKICGDKKDETSIEPLGHNYKLSNISNNMAVAECTVCGDKRDAELPVGMSVFWRNELSTSHYYYGAPSDLYVNEQMVVMASLEFSDSDNYKLSDIILDTGKEQLPVKYTKGFSFDKAGTYPVKVYSKYRPEISTTVNIDVCDRLTSVTLVPDSKAVFEPGKKITLNAVSGGKWRTTYKFVQIKGDGTETVVQDSGDNGYEWTPKAEGTYRFRADAVDPDDDNKAVSGTVLEIVIKKGGGYVVPADPGNTADPTDPSNPANPGSTTDPANPANPGNPGNSGNATDPTDPANRVNQTGADGTALGKGASKEAAEAAIAAMTSDEDLPGAVFNKLQLRSYKQTNTSITLSWKKVSGAKKYVIYGNRCGSKRTMKRLVTSTGKSRTFKKVLGKKVKKGTYYKFMIIALDKNDNVVSSSKIIHVATKGGKVGNVGKVTTRAKNNKAVIKKGKKFKLAGKQVPAIKRLKVKEHRKVTYESTNPKIATVSGKGVIKGKQRGTCYVYAYAQNGVFAKIKVTVK